MNGMTGNQFKAAFTQLLGEFKRVCEYAYGEEFCSEICPLRDRNKKCLGVDNQGTCRDLLLQYFSHEANRTLQRQMSDEKRDEFEKLCTPLVEFLQKHHSKCNPFSWIIIKGNVIAFMPDSVYCPLKVPDSDKVYRQNSV